MDLFLEYADTEFVTVDSLLIEVSLEINFPHNGQVSACKVAQRAKGLRDSEHQFKCFTRVHLQEIRGLCACGCTRELVEYTFLYPSGSHCKMLQF